MRLKFLSILSLLSALVSSLAPAQDQTTRQNSAQIPRLSPEQLADTEALRALANSTPLLPV